jgi:hypothetical protein
MQLSELARRVRPEETVLLLGAGASVPAGGYTGAGLAEHLCAELSEGEVESTDFSEACSLLEDRYSRAALVHQLQEALDGIHPDGGLLGLMQFDWPRIYTTNYDQLVERTYQTLKKPLQVVRANRDFGRLDSGTTELIKIHGCTTRDRALGHQDSMVLTERDNDDYSDFREALFGKLYYDLHTKDVLIIGQSLRDPHLRRLINEVSSRAKKQGTENRVKVLAFDLDPARVCLLEERNLQAANGTITQLVELIHGATSVRVPRQESGGGLTRQLVHRTQDVASALSQPPNANRVFQGSAATYADIEAGYTFAREGEDALVQELAEGNTQFLTILGAAGVGKSTLARRILHTLSRRGYACYEHTWEFPLSWQDWIAMAERGRYVFLLIDEAPRHLTALNRLCKALDEFGNKNLRCIITAHVVQWELRSRSSSLKRYGKEVRLSTLSRFDIESLVNLCRSQKSIRELIDPQFQILTRQKQISEVAQRCGADMFVALKYCFPGTALDVIVLQEFAQLGSDEQEVYRVVALLDAANASAPRQLVLEILGFTWEDINSILTRTRGVIEQRLINRRDGIFAWSTRHQVIAQTISWYKCADQDELYYLLRRLIASLNSAMLLDRNLIPALCDHEYAIGRVQEMSRRIELLEELIKRGSNRVPWHRLIASYRDAGDLEGAARAVRRAEARVGSDSPIARYKALISLDRAAQVESLGTGDELALILQAEEYAREALRKWPDNKYGYLTLADVGKALVRATGSKRLLKDAYMLMTSAYDKILDNNLLSWRVEVERALANHAGPAVRSPDARNP